MGEELGAPVVGHSSDHAALVMLGVINTHNSIKQINLIDFAWFSMLSFLFLLLKRCCLLLLLDRAAPRHSSRYAELRQYPELQREVEYNETNKPNRSFHRALPSF
jgi:hypothetical protein